MQMDDAWRKTDEMIRQLADLQARLQPRPPANGKLTWWILGVAGSILVAWAVGISSAYVALHGRVVGQETMMAEIVVRLSRIEAKLDRLEARQ